MSNKLAPDQQRAFEQEQMDRPVRSDGEGEAEAVKALLSDDFLHMSNFDATSLALAIQEILRGQKSLLAQIKDTSIEIAKLKEHQAGVDRKMAETLQSERKEIEEILDRSSSLKLTGDAKDREIAKGVKLYQEAQKNVRAKMASDRLMFEEQLKDMPKIMVVSPGVWIQTREGPRLTPEEVRIKHRVWHLNPGEPTMVPQCVAELLQTRRKSQIETQQRKDLLGKQIEQTKLAEAWNKIDGSKTTSMPLA